MSAGISIWSSLRHPTYLRLWLALVSGCCVSAHEVPGSWALNSSRASALVLSWTLARAEQFGAFAAFLCSTHAGYLTGQNIVLNGGAYPGLT